MGSCDYFDFPEPALITTVVAKLCPTLYNPMDTRLLCPWTSPGKNTGVGCISFFRGSSQPRDRTLISCIGRRILYH